MMTLNASQLDWLKIQAWTFLQYGQPNKAAPLIHLLVEHQPQCRHNRKLLALLDLEAKRSDIAAQELVRLLRDSKQLKEQTALWFSLSQARWHMGDRKRALRAHQHYVASKKLLLLGESDAIH